MTRCRVPIFQLRYYDSPDDSNCKGFIDLADVECVQALNNIQGIPKKAGENAFFEVRVAKLTSDCLII